MQRHRRRRSRRFLAPVTFVLTAGVILTIALFAPGPTWIYFAAAGLVLLVGVLCNRDMAQLVLALLAQISPPLAWALSYGGRSAEFEEVVRNMDRTLQRFGLPTLEADELEELSASPPYAAEDDLATCCENFATRLENGDGEIRPAAEILELLYRDTHELKTHRLWRRTTPVQRRRLAEILARSGQLLELETGDRMVELVRWVLDRLPHGFSTRRVADELGAFTKLSLHLSGYAGYLRASEIAATFDRDALRDDVDRELRGGLLVSDYDRVAASVLTGMSRRWIRSNGEGENLSPGDADRLAILGLGIYTAELAPADTCWLPQLAVQVARDPGTLDLLLAYLWKRSRPREEGRLNPGLQELAKLGPVWRAEAETQMGRGIRDQIRAVLTSHLLDGSWPTWLPIHQTIAKIAEESRKIHGQLDHLVHEQRRDQTWRTKMEELLIEAGDTEVDARQFDPDKLIQAVESAVESKLESLAPPMAADAPDDAVQLEDRLETFAGQFRTEARMQSISVSFARALESVATFRERAGELSRRLDDLSDLLMAESGGGSAYVITFDQHRGGLADLIDSLAGDYGFEHYTRYSRIGLLPRGESFEAFYRRLQKALEERLASAIAAAARPSEAEVSAAERDEAWEQIEITVQQISLFHRHDFVTDAAGTLETRLPDGAAFTKVFKVPPSSSHLAAPAA